MRSSKLSNTPKQYAQGWVEFYKLKFKVTPDVLIPRPETELLVDYVTDSGAWQSSTILDIGTGAGNIAISLAKQLPTSDVGIRIIATDVSSKALKVAVQNAKLHGVEDRIEFIRSDLLSDLTDTLIHRQTKPLIIVTNLPYIPSARIPYLDSLVKDFEPHIALDGGEDGFELYRKLFKQINRKKWRPKLIIGEIDYTHGQLALNEAQKYFPNSKVEVKTDLAYKQRILLVNEQ